MRSDEYFVKKALIEAKKAYNENEVPVGCVIVYQDKIIARSHNKKAKTKNPTSHAEIIAISKASKKLNTWILEDCTMYVTLEPCIMCCGAIILSRIKKVVYCTKEPKFGCAKSLGNVFADYKFNHQVEVIEGICQEEASSLLINFFKEIRNKKKIENDDKK